MHCSKCGNLLLSDQAVFCQTCGFRLQPLPPAQPVKSKPQGNNYSILCLTLALLISVGGLLFFVASVNVAPDRSSENDLRGMYPYPTPPTATPDQSLRNTFIANANAAPPVHQQPTPSTETIEPRAFTVSSRSIKSWTIVIPDQYSRGRIVGRFEASGGDGNDIEVYITDEDGMTNLRNNHQMSGWYDSGKVTVGEIDATLKPGTYYLVFNNRFSFLTNKAINSEIKVEMY